MQEVIPKVRHQSIGPSVILEWLVFRPVFFHNREGNASVPRCTTPVIVHLVKKKDPKSYVLGRVQVALNLACLLYLQSLDVDCCCPTF